MPEQHSILSLSYALPMYGKKKHRMKKTINEIDMSKYRVNYSPVITVKLHFHSIEHDGHRLCRLETLMQNVGGKHCKPAGSLLDHRETPCQTVFSSSQISWRRQPPTSHQIFVSYTFLGKIFLLRGRTLGFNPEPGLQLTFTWSIDWVD